MGVELGPKLKGKWQGGLQVVGRQRLWGRQKQRQTRGAECRSQKWWSDMQQGR